MMIKAVLIDDERPALRELEYLLAKYKEIEIAGMFTDAWEAIEEVAELSPQVVFLDINMPQLQGIDAASRIMECCPRCDIVFVTAYDHYAIEAFELHALDYVLKPISVQRFDKSIKRIFDRNQPTLPAEAGRKFSIITLGTFQVGWQGQEPVKWRSEKTRELFAFLLHHAGQEVSRDKILAEVWGDTELKKAVHGLHNGIYYIRKTLQEYGVPKTLVTIKGNYMLILGDVEVDADAFKRSMKDYKENGGNIACLEQTESCYSGDYLEDCGWMWAEVERERLHQQYMEAVINLAGMYMQTAFFDKAELVLSKAFKRNPYTEAVSVMLISLYRQTNRKNQALKHYKTYARLLEEEFGITPEDNIRKLITN